MQKSVAQFTLLRDVATGQDAGRSRVWLDSSLQRQVAALQTTDITMQEMVDGLAAEEAGRLLAVAHAITARTGVSPPFAVSDTVLVVGYLQSICSRVIGFSDWLAERADAAGEAAIATELENLKLDDAAEVTSERLLEVRNAVGDAVIASAGSGAALGFLAEATRLYLVLQMLLEIRTTPSLAAPAVVRALMARSLMLPPNFGLLFPQARVPLVRAAAVSDLYLVKSEWRGYVRGELAALKGVMPGEHFKQEDSRTRETESTTVTETVQTSEQEQSEESRNSSELSKEVATALTASLQTGANAEVSGVFPGGTYRVGANAQGSIGVSRSERLATRTAQEAVSKAVSRVSSTLRSQRSERELVRLVSGQEYRLENDGAGPVRGVYRWVDRVERFQVFRIPDRLQLEFQFPQPAEFFKARQLAARASRDGSAPPEWKVTLDATSTDSSLQKILTQEDANKLAARYRAGDLPPMPKEKIAVTETAMLKAEPVRSDTSDPPTVLSPVAAGRLEVIVPDGYEAIEVEYFLSAAPAKGRWVREKSDNQSANPGFDVTEAHVFHSIVAEAFIGAHSEFVTDWKPEGEALNELFTTQGSAFNRSPTFGNAFARSSGVRTVKFVDTSVEAPVRTRLPMGFRSIGASHLQVTVRVHCRRTAESFTAWQHQVHDAVFSGWSQWNEQFQSESQASTLFGRVAGAERSPTRNRQAIHEELKRQVVAWLLDESPFQGRASLKASQGAETWRDAEVDRTIANAPTIQFLEQAIDWPNMSWIFYPYYWADRAEWGELASIEAGDPALEAFLRAGSARVLVPVRKSFETSVNFWLVYRQPFMGRGLPLPGDDLFVALADEVRNLADPGTEAEPVGRSWDVRTATEFVWLDDSATLPANDHPAIGVTVATQPVSPIAIG